MSKIDSIDDFLRDMLQKQLHFWMYTRVHNGMLCTQEYQADFIVEAIEAFSIWFRYSHYTVTSVC